MPATQEPETTLHPFTVWQRHHRAGRWKPILGAATESEAVAQAVARRFGGEWQILSEGRDPNHKSGKTADAAIIEAVVRASQAGDTRAVDALRGELSRRGLSIGMPSGGSEA